MLLRFLRSFSVKIGLSQRHLRVLVIFMIFSSLSWVSLAGAKAAKSAQPQTSPSLRSAKNKRVQEVNFEEMALQGQIRNPYGSYLVQKNGLKFVPLYEIQKDMDDKIRSASEWTR